jgi:biopolymer transport protein ExbD
MPLKTSTDDQVSMNLTPMLDVVFTIIFFFLVASKFVDPESNIALDVPRVADQGTLTAAPEKQMVNVHRNGSITLNDQAVTAEELTQQLAAARAQYAELGVVVRGDAAGQFQNVATALNAVRQAGISDLGIAVRVTGEGD